MASGGRSVLDIVGFRGRFAFSVKSDPAPGGPHGLPRSGRARYFGASTDLGRENMSQQQVVAELAPHGVLRAAINMGNFLLVTGRTPSGDPDGCSPDMARAIAASLGVPVQMVPYAKPGELADDAEKDKWDIGLIGAEPARAEKIDFTAAYVEIEATYLVPAGSPIKSISEVDVKGNRIAVTARSAYDLWLERNIHNATLHRGNSQAAVVEMFLNEKMEALAGLRPGLIGDVAKIPGSRMLDGQFTAVQQAIGTPKKNAAAAAWLKKFVEDAKKSGAVATLIEKHGVVGRLSVAPPV
jgi:polar amino acid transport system substrate-binding protein